MIFSKASLLAVLGVATAIQDAAAFNHPDLKKRDALIPRQTSTTTNDYSTEYWFDQLIDHANSSAGTFKQRYFFSDQYYKGQGAPIVLGTPGEQSADGFNTDLTGASMMNLMMESWGAAGVVLEHRYYGKSSPYTTLTAPNLQYLTIQQAIDDYKYFVETIVLPWATGAYTSTPSSTPWVNIGGSDSGLLVAYTQEKYPDLFAAAYSTSAPVNADGVGSVQQQGISEIRGSLENWYTAHPGVTNTLAPGKLIIAARANAVDKRDEAADDVDDKDDGLDDNTADAAAADDEDDEDDEDDGPDDNTADAAAADDEDDEDDQGDQPDGSDPNAVDDEDDEDDEGDQPDGTDPTANANDPNAVDDEDDEDDEGDQPDSSDPNAKADVVDDEDDEDDEGDQPDGTDPTANPNDPNAVDDEDDEDDEGDQPDSSDPNAVDDEDDEDDEGDQPDGSDPNASADDVDDEDDEDDEGDQPDGTDPTANANDPNANANDPNASADDKADGPSSDPNTASVEVVDDGSDDTLNSIATDAGANDAAAAGDIPTSANDTTSNTNTNNNSELQNKIDELAANKKLTVASFIVNGVLALLVIGCLVLLFLSKRKANKSSSAPTLPIWVSGKNGVHEGDQLGEYGTGRRAGGRGQYKALEEQT